MSPESENLLEFLLPFFAIFAISIITLVICFRKIALDRNRAKTWIVQASDKELIAEYQRCATDIQTSLNVANGLTGAFSSIATNKVNQDISRDRALGRKIGNELISRGYSVDFSVLEGNVTKGQSDISKVIKGAVVGGIIAGDVGAVIGAAHAMSKNKKK